MPLIFLPRKFDNCELSGIPDNRQGIDLNKRRGGKTLSKNVVHILRPELTEEDRDKRMRRIHDAAVRLLTDQAREARGRKRDTAVSGPEISRGTSVQL